MFFLTTPALPWGLEISSMCTQLTLYIPLHWSGWPAEGALTWNCQFRGHSIMMPSFALFPQFMQVRLLTPEEVNLSGKPGLFISALLITTKMQSTFGGLSNLFLFQKKCGIIISLKVQPAFPFLNLFKFNLCLKWVNFQRVQIEA